MQSSVRYRGNTDRKGFSLEDEQTRSRLEKRLLLLSGFFGILIYLGLTDVIPSAIGWSSVGAIFFLLVAIIGIDYWPERTWFRTPIRRPVNRKRSVAEQHAEEAYAFAD